MPNQNDRVPFSRKLGGGPGCFTLVELQTAFFALIPATAETRADGLAKGLAIAFGTLAAMVCFWAVVQLNWHIMRRLFFDASGNEIARSERASAGLACIALIGLALGGFPSYALGRLAVRMAEALAHSVGS